MNGFRFNTDKFDFWPIYEAIKKYYPIGVEIDPEFYRSYSGHAELINILSEKVHNDENYTSIWTNFENKLALNTGKTVIGTSYGQNFCYSATLVVTEEVHNNFTYRNLIHFFVSFLGPFYCVIGESQNELKINQDEQLPRSGYLSTNYLVASPYGDFVSLFKTVEQFIEAAFEGYKFIPYWINEQVITGLYLHHQNQNPTVFNVLFNDHIVLNNQRYPSAGDLSYRSEDWFKTGYDPSKEGRWSVYPPLSALKGMDNEISTD